MTLISGGWLKKKKHWKESEENSEAGCEKTETHLYTKLQEGGPKGHLCPSLISLALGFWRATLNTLLHWCEKLKNAVVDRTVFLRASEKTTLDQKQNNCTPSTACSSAGSQPAVHLHLPVSQMIEKKHRNLQLTVWLLHPDLLMFFLYLFAVCLLMCACFLSNSQHAPSHLGSENRCIWFFLGRLSSISPIS